MQQIIRLIKLPVSVKGITVMDCDGNYNVYINKDYSYETQKDIYRHETDHINSGDFSSAEPVKTIENRVHYRLKRFKR